MDNSSLSKKRKNNLQKSIHEINNQIPDEKNMPNDHTRKQILVNNNKSTYDNSKSHVKEEDMEEQVVPQMSEEEPSFPIYHNKEASKGME